MARRLERSFRRQSRRGRRDRSTANKFEQWWAVEFDRPLPIGNRSTAKAIDIILVGCVWITVTTLVKIMTTPASTSRRNHVGSNQFAQAKIGANQHDGDQQIG